MLRNRPLSYLIVRRIFAPVFSYISYIGGGLEEDVKHNYDRMDTEKTVKKKAQGLTEPEPTCNRVTL